MASGNHSLSLNHHQHFKPNGYGERGLSSTNTLSLCNWQPQVITACTAAKLHKQEKIQQTIVKNIIPYHGVCLLSDKACVDCLRAASTHCLYSTTDTLLLAGKTKSNLKPCLARETACVFANVCQHVCEYASRTWDVLNQQRPCRYLHESTFCFSVNLPFKKLQQTFNENTLPGDWSH